MIIISKNCQFYLEKNEDLKLIMLLILINYKYYYIYIYLLKMTTLERGENSFEERKRYKGDAGDLDIEPFTYFDASKTDDISYFQAFVEMYPPSNPENLPRLEGIEGALFYEYGDENNMYKNEAIFMILISNGYEFSSDLFALLVCGSIYSLICDETDKKYDYLKACIEYYCKLEININDIDELMTQTHSFIRYMYDIESNNQEPFQDALLGIHSSIRSFRTKDGDPLFPKFNYYI
jgi:hypothetical protein